MLENLELNWLQKNYAAVETTNEIIKSMCDYTLEDWKNGVTSISFDDVKSFSKAISILKSMKALKTVDFNDYNSEYEITINEYNELKEAGISVILNNKKVYKDSNINYIINKAQIDLLNKKREALLAEIEKIDIKLSELGC